MKSSLGAYGRKLTPAGH